MSIIIPPPVTPGSNLLELAAQKNMTHWFILRLPVEITLVPHAVAKQPTGGTKLVAQTPRVAQIMTLIESPVTPRPTVTQDGVERFIEFELLGEWDASMDRFDSFTHDGKEWEIVELFHFNGWERRALVSRRG